MILGQPGSGSFRGFQGGGPPPGTPYGSPQNNRPFGLYKPPGFEVSGPPNRQTPGFNGGPQQPITGPGPNFGPPDSTNFEQSYGPDIGPGIGPRSPPNTGTF